MQGAREEKRTMEETDMLEKLIEIVAEQLHVEETEVKPETDFKEDLRADSLDLFELVMALEEEYDVEIPTEDLEKLTTVQAVLDYLKQKGITPYVGKNNNGKIWRIPR